MEATAGPDGPGPASGHPPLLSLSIYTGALVLALEEFVILKQTGFVAGP
jgi:hypothetical protein